MKILIYGINYSPDLTGIGKYTGEMGAWLSNKSHTVDVITAMPYYPQWAVNPSYKRKLWHSEKIAGATVKRCPLYVPKKVTGAKRMIHEFSFFLSSSIFWIGALFKSYDVLFTPYPPLVIGIWPRIYTLLHPKTTWVFHIQDLQVDAARELGLIKNQKLLSLLSSIELYWLKKAHKVSSISSGMKDRILRKGVQESNYIMLPNWAETDIIKPLSKNESLRAELNIPASSKVVLYSGNLGEKQGVDMIIDAAAALQSDPNLLFVIAGEGASKANLIAYAQTHNINNVLFLPLQPYHKLAAFLAIADIHLVIQKKSAADLVLPSKFMSILSAGGVAIVTTEPETTLFQMIDAHQLAYVCEPENEKAFIHLIKEVVQSDVSQISANARNYAEAHLSIDAILGKFVDDIGKK